MPSISNIKSMEKCTVLDANITNIMHSPYSLVLNVIMWQGNSLDRYMVFLSSEALSGSGWSNVQWSRVACVSQMKG